MSAAWNIAGIDASTREAAKAAAHDAGLPVGGWLTQIIRRAVVVQVKGTEPTVENTSSSALLPVKLGPEPGMQGLLENVQDLLIRIEKVEEVIEVGETPAAVAPVERAVARISDRLDRIEREFRDHKTPTAPRLFGLKARKLLQRS